MKKYRNMTEEQETKLIVKSNKLPSFDCEFVFDCKPVLDVKLPKIKTINRGVDIIYHRMIMEAYKNK